MQCLVCSVIKTGWWEVMEMSLNEASLVGQLLNIPFFL